VPVDQERKLGDRRRSDTVVVSTLNYADSQYGEVVTINNDAGLLTGTCNRNEYNVKSFTRNNWRASLVPAAAVILAPIAYIKVVVVKKLVVGFWGTGALGLSGRSVPKHPPRFSR